jgi:hypothetical protein
MGVALRLMLSVRLGKPLAVEQIVITFPIGRQE